MPTPVVYFQNDGCIDPRCITTIGVSVKESSDPIGFFGTGLKYAIAIILRGGGSISIWVGLEELKFTSIPVKIRGNEVNVVCMNGQELAFTTDLGKHWKVWQALREIYCNTLDEKGTSGFEKLEPSEGKTTILVQMEEFATCFTNLSSYFLQSEPFYKGPVEFHPTSSSSIFYRSVKVGETKDKPYYWTPNLIEHIDLTEDRTVKDYWKVDYNIAKAILDCKNKFFLEKWLTIGERYAEHEVDLNWIGLSVGETFLEVVEHLSYDSSRQLNVTAKQLLSKFGKVVIPSPCTLMGGEAASVQKAIKFCRSLQYMVDEFPIVFVESLGPGVLGQAVMNSRTILISRKAIQMGDLTLATTLIEEWVHIKHGVYDCTREMQNWLLDQVGRLGLEYLHLARESKEKP